MSINTNKSFSLEELKHICAGDEKFVSEMIQVFIKTTEEGISGMQKALLDKNFSSISQRAHKIASPCQHMGAISLYNLLKKIELLAENPANENDLKPMVEEAGKIAAEIISELKNELKKLT